MKMPDMKVCERVATVMKTALESDEETGVVEVDGQALQYTKKPAPGIRLKVEPAPGAEAGSAVYSTVFEPAESMPNGYPAGIPFLAGRVAAVITVPGETEGVNVQWQVEDPKAAAKELVDLSESDGWTRQKKGLKIPLFLPIGIALLERDDRTRTIIDTSVGSRGVVMLMEVAK
jgi:hypothetical protein